METKSDPELVGNDKQVSLAAGVKDDRMLFHADQTTWMDWLLEVAEEDEAVEITSKRVKEIEGQDYIVSISALVPVGYLTLKSKKRSNNNLSSVVSKPSNIKDDFSWAE